ncbi:hypothetical protein LCGC14_0737170 [marine sediment metagenome]|uniref:Uncharacterized protein n=1 Tax=marine sediment metagenome TaxID=412755 RepID=A0A0F9QBX3_9ZZZZ
MIRFENKNEGTWFFADAEKPEIGGICLRVLSAEEHNRIESITTRSKKKVKRGVAFDDVTTDEPLAAKLRMRFCIVDWKGLQLNGKDVQCDDTTKVEMCKSIEFLDWLGDCLEALTEKTSALDEARLGNSSDLPSGASEKTK